MPKFLTGGWNAIRSHASRPLRRTRRLSHPDDHCALRFLEPLEPRLLLSSNPAIGIALVSDVFDPPEDVLPEDNGELNTLDSIPLLHSLPGAPATLYLDFDGHFQAVWGDQTPGQSPPYDIDGDRTTFSDLELNRIFGVWTRVAEDFAPFNIDVTTEEPPVIEPGKSIRAAIGGSFDDWFKEEAGGVAFVGSFADGINGGEPGVVYVWPDNLAGGDEASVADASSHEFGHALGLQHQVVFTEDEEGNPLVERNTGSDTPWNPIMGAYKPITTWHFGPDEQNAGPDREPLIDEMAVIAGETNGFGFRPDDHANSGGLGSPLRVPGTADLLGRGLIGPDRDIDVFVFESGIGTIELLMSSPSRGPNLDAELELYDPNGVLVAPVPDDPGGGEDPPPPPPIDLSDLTASISYEATEAGVYYVVAKSSGVYGLIGQYEITGTAPAAAGAIVGRKFQDVNGNGVFDTSGVREIDLPIELTDPGEVVLEGNDDGFTDEPIDIGFNLEYFGQNYSELFINNNGVVSFGNPVGNFPNDVAFFGLPVPKIAPFWSDVDTNVVAEVPPPLDPDFTFQPELVPPPDDYEPPTNATVFASGEVTLARGTSPRGNPFMQVDWRGVGYFNLAGEEVVVPNEKTNDFSLYIENDVAGDIVAFVYRNLFWTTGDFSDGAGGVGGVGAQIGFDTGDGEHFVDLGGPSTLEQLVELRHSEKVFRLDPGPALPESEPGLEGWTIFLDLNENGVFDDGEPTTVTDINGNYSFLDLEAGDYMVGEVLMPDWYQTFPATEVHALDFADTHLVTVEAGGLVADVDFGNIPLGDVFGTISGRKFEDLDADGVREAGEPGLEDWTIYLDLNDNGELDDGEPSDLTSPFGQYRIEGLLPGVYTVREVQQDDWQASTPEGGSFEVALNVNRIVNDLDFGNYHDGSLSGIVFDDIDGDGAQDDGESGLAGVIVYLELDGDEGLTAGDRDTTTDGDGQYGFDGLEPGAYTAIVINPDPEARRLTVPADGQRDADVVSGRDTDQVDFGIAAFAGIAGTKFEDVNGNGAFDAEEPRLEGWTIYVDLNDDGELDEGEPVSVTNSAGVFSFGKLVPGSYILREVLKEGWGRSVPEDQLEVSIASGHTVSDLEFGNFRLASIEGTKWEDSNGNGVRDEEDGGLSGWRIYIDADGNAQFDDDERFAITDDDGRYLIDNLAAGEYTVREELQPEFDPSIPGGGSHVVTLASGQNATGVDFGNFELASIGGTKFEDLNGNGLHDPDEPVLAGWTIFVDEDGDGGLDVDEDLNGNGELDLELEEAPLGMDFNDDGDALDVVSEDIDGDGRLDRAERSTVTDALGQYEFDGLVPGAYVIGEVVPDGWGQSRPGHPDFFHTVALTSGTSVNGLDFGNFRSGSIHGLAWADTNNNGVFEPPLDSSVEASDITLAPRGPVVLIRNDDQSTALVNFGFDFEFFGGTYDQFYINNNGNITFTEPLFQFTPDGFPQFLPIVAPFWADVDTRPEQSGQVHLARGTSSRGNPFVQIDWPDVGYYANRIDRLNDFTLYIEDDPAGDLVAFIYRNMEWTTGEASESENGFGGTGAQIGFDSGDGENFISLGRPRTPADIARFADRRELFRIDPGGVPLQERGLLNVTIYVDENDNGQFDEGEPSTVTMQDDLATDDVDELGHYWLEGIAAGTHTVRVVPPDGAGEGFPGDGYEVVVESGLRVENIDFGVVDLGSISGRKFDDLNADGVQDPGEPGLEGWTIFIDDDGDGFLDDAERSTVTDADGNYLFDGVDVGTHRVAEVLEAGWTQSFPEGDVHLVDIALGRDVTGVDFGNYRAATIRGTKFADVEGDGQRDEGDGGLEGWTIFIDDDGDGQLDEGERSTVTDADGRYVFEDLTPGAYVLAEVARAGWTQSFPAPVGEDPGVHVVGVSSGEVAEDVDFGNFLFVIISGTKWNDLDGDGARDGNEPGLAGWTIFLDENANDLLDDGETATVTDGDGRYSFMTAPGDHRVAEVLQDHWYQSWPLTGVHPVDEAGAHELSPEGGAVVDDADFGNFELGVIEGTSRGTIDPDGEGPLDFDDEPVPGFIVFLDLNDNGEFDDGEPFQETGPDGRYRFEDLLPGDYRVVQQERPLWVPGGPLGDTSRDVNVGLGENVDEIDFLSDPNGPDLVVSSIDVSGLFDTLVPGDGGKVFVEIRNIGTEPVHQTLALDLFLSTDTALDGGDFFIGDLGTLPVNLGPGQSRVVRVPVNIGQHLDQGDYYTLAHVDADNVVAETLDENNVGASDETRAVAWTFGSFGGRRNVKLTVIDPRGVPVTFSLNVGMGEIVGQNNFDEIILTGTNRRSNLVIRTKGRDVSTTIHGLTAYGSLNIQAKTTNLGAGDYRVMGQMRKGQFDDVHGPALITIDEWDGRSTVNLTFGDAHDLSVTSRAPIGTLSTYNTANTDDVPDVIEAPWIKSLRSKMNFANDLNMTSSTARFSLGSARVSGWFEGLTAWLPNDLGNLRFGGMRHANIYNGVRRDFLDDARPGDNRLLPDSAEDFLQNQAMIRSLTVTGIKGEPYAVINSNVATWLANRIRYGVVKTTEVRPHGIAAHAIKSYFRERVEPFSPTSRNLSGPVLADADQQYTVDLIGAGTRNAVNGNL